ncbi:hypothetical protein PcPA57_09230 [Pasteurella canis]|uniref:hypothetical protein n=1 Tax=Pasteurella canis TaxID=753 RepID=UPI001E5C4BF1|nr:hypothetical protein [Pasteurella canis]GJJ80203.1 hypothetical protein PcPA57_09230 [Pasteurella canis]
MVELIESNRKLTSSVQENRRNIRLVATNLYLVNPSIAFLSDETRDKLYLIYNEITKKFDIPFNNIFITGSAHIGFSLKKNCDFNRNSDLDISIISASLFNKILNCILDESNYYRSNHIFKDQEQLRAFKENISRGKIHPLYFPNGDTKNNWDSFFQKLSREHHNCFSKITACVYLSEECFRFYQEESLSKFCVS